MDHRGPSLQEHQPSDVITAPAPEDTRPHVTSRKLSHHSVTKSHTVT